MQEAPSSRRTGQVVGSAWGRPAGAALLCSIHGTFCLDLELPLRPGPASCSLCLHLVTVTGQVHEGNIPFTVRKALLCPMPMGRTVILQFPTSRREVASGCEGNVSAQPPRLWGRQDRMPWGTLPGAQELSEGRVWAGRYGRTSTAEPLFRHGILLANCKDNLS